MTTLLQPGNARTPDDLLPTTAPSQRAILGAVKPHPYLAVFAALVFFGQRLSVPGIPVLPLGLVVFPALFAFGYFRGRFQVSRGRLALYFVLVGATALVTVLQPAYLSHNTSLGSLLVHLQAFFLLLFTPNYLSAAEQLATKRFMFGLAEALGWISTAFIALSVAGIAYVDVLKAILPSPFLLTGFADAYPIVWGSPIYKSNAWVGLEPSFVSFVLGASLLAMLVHGAPKRQLVAVTAGMLATVSGSGIFLATIGAAVLVVRAENNVLRRRVLMGAAFATAVIVASPLRGLIGPRLTEFTDSNSSTSLRGIAPYGFTTPAWLENSFTSLFGYGAGHSERLAQATQIDGMFAPTPARMAFDFGLIVGGLMLIVFTWWLIAPHQQAVGVAAAVSFLSLQPTTPTLIVATLCLGAFLATPRSTQAHDRKAVNHGTNRGGAHDDAGTHHVERIQTRSGRHHLPPPQ